MLEVNRSQPGAKWWHTLEDGRLQCDLCPRYCKLRDGDRGFCFVRQNVDGQMVLTTYGLSTGLCADPVEKKPLYHFLPGSRVLSFGTAGCNLGCQFCQNWSISKSKETSDLSEEAPPGVIADLAVKLGCRSVAFTYNDPIIWAEYAMDTARHCHRRGLKTIAVTNGYISPVAREEFFLMMDAANVDLKGFSEQFYRRLTLSHLAPVLDTLYWIRHSSRVWLEITNLIIPGENDSDEEIEAMSRWILNNLGAETPLHFTAFTPAYRMCDHPRTAPVSLARAGEIARQTGLKYVYEGNVCDPVAQSTYCSNCRRCLVERNGYVIGEYRLNGNECSFCNAHIPGVFDLAKRGLGRGIRFMSAGSD